MAGQWPVNPGYAADLRSRLVSKVDSQAASHPLVAGLLDAARQRLGLPDRRLVEA